jgi:hypothetical protein
MRVKLKIRAKKKGKVKTRSLETEVCGIQFVVAV